MFHARPPDHLHLKTFTTTPYQSTPKFSHFYNYPCHNPANHFPDIPQTTRISPTYPVPLIQVHTFTPPALHLPRQNTPCRYILNFPAIPRRTRISLPCRKRQLPPRRQLYPPCIIRMANVPTTHISDTSPLHSPKPGLTTPHTNPCHII